MAITYSTTTATNRLTAVQAALNSLTFNAPTGTASNGSIVIGGSTFVNTQGTTGVTTGSTGVLAIIPVPNAGVSVSGRVLTLLASTASASATGTGTATEAALINNAGTIIAGGMTTGTASADVILNSTAISSGQTVSITSASVTHP